MGCNCGGSAAAKNVNHVFTDSSGVQRTYRTEIEAKAAQIRSGGGGNIRTVAR